MTEKTQHCAGALLFIEKVNPGATQAIRIAERLRLYQRDQYSGSEKVVDSWREMILPEPKTAKQSRPAQRERVKR